MGLAEFLDACLPGGKAARSVNVSRRHGYVYVTTPKCGCTAVLSALQRLELGDPGLHPKRGGTIHARAKSPLPPLGLDEAAAALLDGSLFRFTFVRSPFTRLLSAYLNKIVRKREQRPQVNALLGLDPGDMDTHVSFGDFAEAVSRQEPRQMDQHWRPLVLQTFACGVEYDFVGRFETFQRDIRAVDARLGGVLGPYLSAEPFHPTFCGQRMLAYYDDALAERVAGLYRDDFQAFGYDTDWRALCWRESARHLFHPFDPEMDLPDAPADYSTRASAV
uniref:Sulfotransferase family protein n=1 Tax=Fundidesulfovibrio putealis TaxID=270496 RepID=A0A7C3WJS7_9BACT